MGARLIRDPGFVHAVGLPPAGVRLPAIGRVSGAEASAKPGLTHNGSTIGLVGRDSSYLYWAKFFRDIVFISIVQPLSQSNLFILRLVLIIASY